MTTATDAMKTKAASPSTMSALRSPNFRLYFFGQLISVSGTWMQNIAQGYLIFNITQSELWLGVVACVSGLPLILLSPVTGVVVERMPRRRLLMITQFIQMILAFILATLSLTNNVQIWHIVVLAFLLGSTDAFDLPARQAFVVEMVGKEDLHSGIALNSILNSIGRVLGPTVAGIALVKLGVAWCFFLNGLSFLAVLGSLVIMSVPHAIHYVSKSSAIQQLREGLQFARRDPLVTPLLLMASISGLFLVPIIRLLPAYADVILHSPEEGYAAMSAAQGLGSVIGGALVGWTAQRLGYGKLITLAMIGSAIATILMAFQRDIPPAAVMGVFSGIFLILELVSVNTQIQIVVPDEFRGRVLALYTLALVGLAPFGSLVLGALANVIGTDGSLALYGLLSGVLGAVVILRWRNILRPVTPGSEYMAETPVASIH